MAGKARPGVVAEVTRGSASPRARRRGLSPDARRGVAVWPVAAGAAAPFHLMLTARVDNVRFS